MSRSIFRLFLPVLLFLVMPFQAVHAQDEGNEAASDTTETKIDEKADLPLIPERWLTL